jgi:hypothetical protein
MAACGTSWRDPGCTRDGVMTTATVIMTGTHPASGKLRLPGPLRWTQGARPRPCDDAVGPGGRNRGEQVTTIE